MRKKKGNEESIRLGAMTTGILKALDEKATLFEAKRAIACATCILLHAQIKNEIERIDAGIVIRDLIRDMLIDPEFIRHLKDAGMI
jgi:hypothetical protein